MATLMSKPLTAEEFLPYGQVIEAKSNDMAVSANQGTSRRHNHLANLSNLKRPQNITLENSTDSSNIKCVEHNDASANLCVFSATPTSTLPFPIKLLERHKFSSQMFVPMTKPDWNARSYLVIVCLNNPVTDKPDMATLKTFIATSIQGINYEPG